MKTIETTIAIDNAMTEEKKVEVRALVLVHRDDFYTAEELAEYLEHGYIFGPLGDSEHYLKDEFMEIINDVSLEKNPPVDVPLVE